MLIVYTRTLRVYTVLTCRLYVDLNCIVDYIDLSFLPVHFLASRAETLGRKSILYKQDSGIIYRLLTPKFRSVG